MYELSIWIVLLAPLASFLVNALAGRWLREIGGWIAVVAMLFAALLSSVMFVSAWLANLEYPNQIELPIRVGPVWEWMSAWDFSVSVGFYFDALTAVMCFIITFVGSLVFLYSIGYMAGDPGISRFFAYLSLFVFSMLILVLGDSFPVLFVGWEGVGLCSYLLIGYYMDMKGAPQAGMKAFVVNRIGDFGFLLAMFLIFQHLGTLDIQEALNRAEMKFEVGAAAATTIALLMLLGCAGKSAQIPLFIWLPDAMAGPTPVSALIHAATMVTAGVYLVARTSALFALSPIAMNTMAVVGAATAFVAGTIAIAQRDIKKVLAYSTVSQLGFMFLACGVGAFAVGIFHVFTHAFFKACLFLGAGAVIHSAGGTQDLMLLGGLKKKLRVTWLTYFIASLAIAGFPLTAGFFSKDEILWKTFSAAPAALRPGGIPILYIVGVITALMTAIYMFRSLFLAFHGETRLPEEARHHVHVPPWTMNLPLVVLATGSLVAGFLNIAPPIAHWFGLEGGQFHHFLAHNVDAIHKAEETLAGSVPEFAAEHSEGLELSLAFFSAAIAIGGILIARRFFLTHWPEAADRAARRFAPLHALFRAGWWYDDLCSVVIAGFVARVAELSVWIDRNVIDNALTGAGALARGGGRIVRGLQAGQVQSYAVVMLIGANILLLVILIW